METVKDWKTIYEYLSEARPPLKLRVLDTVVFDSLAVHRPLFKIFSNAAEEVCSLNLRNSSIDKVVQDVLTSTAAITAVHTQIKLTGPAHEKLVLCSRGSSRFLLDLHGLASLSVSHSSGFDGLTVLKKPGCAFGTKVYVHEIVEQSSEVRVRDLGSVSASAAPVSPSVSELVKHSSHALRERLTQVARQVLVQLTACYRYDESKRQVWLLGIDRCVMRENKAAVLPRSASTVSVLRLNESLQVSQAETSALFVHSRTPSRLAPGKWRQQKTDKQRKVRFPGWAQVKDYGSQHVVHLVDSSFLQRSGTLPNFRPYLNLPNRFKHQRQALRTNEAAFKHVAFAERQESVSKASTSSSESDVERSVREAHSAVAFDSACKGAFCSTEVPGFQQPAAYPAESRFLVMEDLVFAAQTPEFSPTLNPSLLVVRPLVVPVKKQPRCKPVRTPFSVGKLFAQNEDIYVPVCLKCYLVYYNVQEALIATAGLDKHD